MTEICFDVLGIAPTKDETTIKKAYRKLLHSVNPEDDMQGFQRLRTAYEEACRYARKREDEPHHPGRYRGRHAERNNLRRYCRPRRY